MSPSIAAVILSGLGFVCTLLLALLAWTGQRMVSQVEALANAVASHAVALARFDQRLEHIEADMVERRGAR